MVQHRLKFIELLGDRTGVAQYFAAGVGEVYAFTQLLEERHAQAFFELLHLHGYGRLGQE